MKCTVQLGKCLAHVQHRALRLGLLIGSDEDALSTPNSSPGIGAQFKPFTPLVPVGIHHMP
ncbi:hypothetical protein D3C76_1767520 [compost metagenome]